MGRIQIELKIRDKTWITYYMISDTKAGDSLEEDERKHVTGLPDSMKVVTG